MSAVLVSTKGQIVLPVAVRKALGLKPGMRVDIRIDGKGARITPAPAKKAVKLEDIQALLKYSGPKVTIEDMRVTDYRD
jgi:AbrB family looped-hinge helix DNA binding protein